MRLSVSDKEPINPVGFAAPFAPKIWASHWSIYEYVDKMLFVYFRCVSYTCMLEDNKDIMNWIEFKQTSIGLYNSLSPGRRQEIIWTSAGILFIRPSE